MNLLDLFESQQQCPECGGISFSDLILAEKKDACYYKVKASAKVWPSAYASGRLVQCRKKGADNYGKSKNEGVAEAINPDITNPAFGHQQQIGDYLYVARYWSKGLKISAYDGDKQIGYAELMYQSAPFDDFADPKTTPKRVWLESEWTKVNPKYQRQGIMSTMYAYAKMLGNSVKPSQTRSDDAKAAWASWRQSGDVKHLTSNEGVAEGSFGQNVMQYPRGSVVADKHGNRYTVLGHQGRTLVVKGVVDGKRVMLFPHQLQQGVAEGLNEFDAQGFQQRYTLYKDGYEIEKFGDMDDAIEYAEDDRRDGDDPWAVYKIVDINKQVVWDSDPYEKPSRIQLSKSEHGVAEAFGPLPKDNQQIRLGRHTVDIERVGLDKNYISFAWHDSKGKEHYEEVAVGDLGSYDDLIDRIKDEIRFQERKYTDQSVAEARSPEEFVRQMDKIAATPQTFEVGDWVTIDPNETSGYASSGMIGRIIELYDDEGESMAKIAVGGGSGVQKKLGKGVRSSGTHTVVPTSILQKDDPRGVAEGLENSGVQEAIVDTVERLFRKNEISDYGALEAIRQGVKHHFSKPGATAESAIEGILNILDKRMSKSGNYVDLGRFKEALRQGVAHQMKKQGVVEGATDTIYPNAEVIKSKNGRPVGEIYQDENGWGFFHYGMDGGNDFIDSREDAIEGLKDFHAENRGRRPDYTIKGEVEEGDDNFGKPAAMMQPSAAAAKTAQSILQKQADKNVIGMAKLAGAVPAQGVGEVNNNKIGGRYDPEEFDSMVQRLKKLAGVGPMKTVYDPQRRVYRNVPVAQQPDKK